jgi:hypothetical protein
MCAMYECRCPHDGKKLAEIARAPQSLGHYDCPCERDAKFGMKRGVGRTDRAKGELDIATVNCKLLPHKREIRG